MIAQQDVLRLPAGSRRGAAGAFERSEKFVTDEWAAAQIQVIPLGGADII